MSTVPKFATYEDVLNAPEHLVAEILDGTLYTHPRLAPRHARAAGRLLGKIDDPFDSGRGGPGGWITLIEPELHLGRDVIVPKSPAGVANGCRDCQRRRGSNWRRIGSARCCRHRPRASTAN